MLHVWLCFSLVFNFSIHFVAWCISPCSWWVTPQRFYPPLPEYLLFSTPVGALWEWKHSVMTPNPPHKAKRLGQFPLHMETCWGVGEWLRGGCGLHVVPWGQIKARDSYLEAPRPRWQALCSQHKRWSKICYRDRCKHHLREPCSPCLRWEKANKNQVDSGRLLFIFQESSAKSG